MHSETDKAYIAGLVDGEGHIAITLRSGQWSGHQVMVKVTNTNILVLEEVARDYGARVQNQRVRSPWKPTVDIHWSAHRAVVFLKEIRPYLRIKAEIADVALALAETMRSPKSKARAISKQEWDYREQLRLKIRTLNARSGSAPPRAVPSPQILKGRQTCQFCKAEFVADRKRKYCTPICLQRSRRAGERERNQRTCPQCGTMFGAQAHQVYCSRTCAQKTIGERRRAA